MNKVLTFITWIKGACGDSAFDGGGEDFDISSEEKAKCNIRSGGEKWNKNMQIMTVSA